MDKNSTFLTEKPIQDEVQLKINELKKQQGNLEKYHEKYRLAKKIIKEWGNLLKKTRQGAQKIMEQQLKNIEITYEDDSSINGINQILNLTKDMLNTFSKKISGYENELLRQHLILKEQGNKLYSCDKQSKDNYKFLKENYDKVAKTFQGQLSKILTESFIQIEAKEQNDQTASKSLTTFLQNNQSCLKTNANQFIMGLEIVNCKIEQQMIISCNKCISSIQSISNLMKPFEFENLKSQIPNFIIEKNNMQIQVIEEYLKQSKASKQFDSQTLSQNQQVQNSFSLGFKEFSQKFENSFIQKKQKKNRLHNNQQKIVNKQLLPLDQPNFNPYNSDIEQSRVQKIHVQQNMQISKQMEKSELQKSERQSLAQSEMKMGNYNQTPQKQNLNTLKESKQKQNKSISPICNEFQFTVHQSDRQDESEKVEKANLKKLLENKQNSESHDQEWLSHQEVFSQSQDI
ncbi:hypothetical protein ABPG74_021511 [Tetrahymena malaccensis]